MDFSLTEDQTLFRDSVRKFMEKECPKGTIEEYDKAGEFPDDIWAKMAELGWLGLPVPEEYGGQGGNVLDFCLLMEELSKGFPAMAFCYSLSVLYGGEIFDHFANDAQKKEHLPKLVRGETKYAAGITEPNAGSDVSAIITRAELDGDYFIINGQKMFTTGAHISDYILLLVRTDKDAPKKHQGLSFIIVPTKSPGITINNIETLGCKTVKTNSVSFEDVKIHKDELLGKLNKGWYHIMDLFDSERIVTGALGVGLATGAFEEALAYSKERVQFGRPIGKFQAIGHKLAEMIAEIESARLMVYNAAWKKVNGEPCMREASIAKLLGTEIAKKAAIQGIQILGGYGYTMEYPLQRYLRDSIYLTVAGGSSEIMKNLICATYGL